MSQSEAEAKGGPEGTRSVDCIIYKDIFWGNKLEIETGQSALFSGLGFNSPDLGTSLKERKKERISIALPA